MRRCPSCATSPQCAAAHQQCFIVYVKQCGLSTCEALDRVRTIALYRSPWPKIPHLYLQPCNQLYADLIARIAPGSDLGRLRSLPLEILDAIKRLSPHALLWRTMSTIALAHQATSIIQPTQNLALASIGKWVRGSKGPALTYDQQPVVKIIIDSSGIREIQRLEEWPSFRSQNSRSEFYIIEEARKLHDVRAQLKVLQLPTVHSSLPESDRR